MAALGFVTSSGNYFGADGTQGTVLDVNVTDGKPYTLTLYYVGGARPAGSPTLSSTKQAIRVMDLHTLDPVAPEPLISDPAGAGVYWSLTYDRGVRLRHMPIDGDAGYSAVFFDRGT